jgi:AcrR family transcriptional regulator
LALDRDKQQRIINAALRVFSLYGYKRTSTNLVAESAGISKGMVFHYFGSKKGMFEYLFEFTFEVVKVRFRQLNIDIIGKDFIEQCKLLAKTKLLLYNDNPYVIEFLTMIYVHPDSLDVSEKAKAICDEIFVLRNQSLLVMQLPESSMYFRTDIEAQDVKKYIMWLIDGYSQQLIAQISAKTQGFDKLSPAQYEPEFDKIMNDLKKVFYE